MWNISSLFYPPFLSTVFSEGICDYLGLTNKNIQYCGPLIDPDSNWFVVFHFKRQKVAKNCCFCRYGLWVWKLGAVIMLVPNKTMNWWTNDCDIWKSYIWTADKDLSMKAILALMNTTWAVVKIGLEKKLSSQLAR